MVLSGISTAFAALSRIRRQIIHVLLTLAPLYYFPEGKILVRLACVRHAASVRSEPGSNSPVIKHGNLIQKKTNKVIVARPATSFDTYSILKERNPKSEPVYAVW